MWKLWKREERRQPRENEASGLPQGSRQHLCSQVPAVNAQSCSLQRHGVKCSHSALEHWMGDCVFWFHRDTGCEDGVLGGELTGRQEQASWAGKPPNSGAGTGPRAPGQQPCCPGKNLLASLAGCLELKADDIQRAGLLSSFERITEPSNLFLHVRDGEYP